MKAAYIARRENEVRNATQQADRYLFRHFDELLGRKLDEITANDIERILDAIDAPSTRRSAYIRISGRLCHAATAGSLTKGSSRSGAMVSRVM